MELYSRYLTYVVFAFAHIARFCHYGLVCSGVYLEKGASHEGYMVSTGNFMLTYIILAWSITPLFLVSLVIMKGTEAA